MPIRSGTITPRTPASITTRPERRIWSRSASSPARNMRKMTPISASSVITSWSSGEVKTGQAGRLSNEGPSSRPARISPSTAGCPSLLLMSPASLAAVMRMESSSRSWRMGDIKNPDCMMASAALDALADCSFSAWRGKHPSVTQQARLYSRPQRTPSGLRKPKSTQRRCGCRVEVVCQALLPGAILTTVYGCTVARVKPT